MSTYKVIPGEGWILRVEDHAHIPFASGNADYQQYLAEVAAGTAVFVPSDPPSVDQYTAAVQAWLDDTAEERNYDHILSACSYVTSTNPLFQAEGQACVAWRDAVWASCYQIMGNVQAGNRAAPATTEDLIAELPTIVWPQ
jgi:hypothetical protein